MVVSVRRRYSVKLIKFHEINLHSLLCSKYVLCVSGAGKSQWKLRKMIIQ